VGEVHFQGEECEPVCADVYASAEETIGYGSGVASGYQKD
jgi:hypothetical protein